MELDEKEKKIVRELIKDPRISDNKLGKKTGIPIITVNRKRRKLEEEEIINYYVHLNTGRTGTGRFLARQLYIIKFRLGIPKSQIVDEIKSEKNVRTRYGKSIFESHIAEIGGHIALIMILEGKSDDDIVEEFNKIILPSLKKNHGENCIIDIQTIRLSDPIRFFHNYIPMLNIKKGKLKKNWNDWDIFIE